MDVIANHCSSAGMRRQKCCKEVRTVDTLDFGELGRHSHGSKMGPARSRNPGHLRIIQGW